MIRTLLIRMAAWCMERAGVRAGDEVQEDDLGIRWKESDIIHGIEQGHPAYRFIQVTEVDDNPSCSEQDIPSWKFVLADMINTQRERTDPVSQIRGDLAIPLQGGEEDDYE